MASRPTASSRRCWDWRWRRRCGGCTSTARFLAAGVATYLGGLAWFRRLLGIGPIGARLLIAAVVLPTVMIGLAVSPEAQLGVLAAVVVGGVLAESAWERRRGPKSSPTRACAGSSGASS